MRAHISTILSILLLSSCDDQKFSSSSQRAAGSQEAEEAQTPGEDTVKTQTFALNTTSQPIDLILMIDNSGSMSDEIAQVNQNFLSFTASISARADISLTLVSKSGPTPLNITMPQALLDHNHRQIDISVGSYNGLSMLASGFCPKEVGPKSGTAIKVCGQDFSRIEWSANVEAMNNRLASILRPTAKLVIVMVSDENSMNVDQSNFINLVKAKVPSFAPTFFGFITDGVRCSSGMIGQAYTALAAATGGAIYPICEPDWKNNFAKLSEAAVKIVSKTFKIPTKVSEIMSLKIDGKPLLPAQYQLKNDEITVSDGVINTSNKQLVIEYK